MLQVKRAQGTGGYYAKIGNGFYGSQVYGSCPSDALFNLERYIGLDEIYRPIVAEVRRRVNRWQISYAELSWGVNLGTIVLPVSV